MKTQSKQACTAQRRWLTIGMSVLLLSACGKDPDSTTQAPQPATQTAPAAAIDASAAEAGSAQAPTPYVTLTLRGMVEERIEVGEPLFVTVRIEAPEEDSPAMQLAPASGSWADHLSLVMLNTDSAEPLLQAKPAVTVAATPVDLQGDQAATGMWIFPSAQTQQLAPGAYRVQARLVITNGSGWTGAAASRAQSLQVVASSADGALQRTIALANEAILNDRPEDAARVLDAQIDTTPDNIRLLTLRAKVSARAGNYLAAMLCVQRAMQLVEIEQWKQLPIDLYTLETELTAALSGESVDQSTLPIWSQAPKAVLSRLEEQRSKDKTSAPDSSDALEPIVPVVPDTSPGTAPDPATNATTVAPVVTADTTSPAAVPATAPITPAASTSSTTDGKVVPPSELNEAAILADPNGQWATTSRAGSEYGPDTYGAVQMIGAPDVPGAGGDNGSAWAHSSSSIALEWIELGYVKPVHASEVRVRQTNVPGTIVKVEAIEPDGTVHVWWEGVDPHVPPDDIDLAWFVVRVPPTPYLVAKMKITLNLAAISGWKEIDAVQLVGAAK